MDIKLGDIILSALEQKQFTQKKAADLLNISPQTLNSFIKNRRLPNLEYFKDMAELLQFDIYAALGLSGKYVTRNSNLDYIKIMQSLNTQQKTIIYLLLNYFEMINKQK